MLNYRLAKEKAIYYIWFFFMIIQFLLPYYFNTIVESNWVLDTFLTALSLLLMFLFLICHYRVLKPSIILIIGMYLWLMISTAINGGNLLRTFLHGIKIVLICVMMDTIIDKGDLTESFMTVVRDITVVFYIVNLFVMIVLPDGIASISVGKQYPWFLYGNVNTTIKYILPGLASSLILDAKKNKAVSFCSVILIAGTIVTALTVYFTATAVIAVVIISAWVVFFQILNRRPFVKYLCTSVLVFLFESLVVIQENGEKLISYISSLFHKSTTLSGRTVLWARAYLYFKSSPVYGHGYQPFEELEKTLGNGYGCHNYYLDILYQRGIIGLAILLILFVVPIILCLRTRKISKPLYILIGICIACSVMLLADPFYDAEILFIPIFYIMFTSAIFINRKKTFLFQV